MSGRRSEYILITDVLALRHGLLRVARRRKKLDEGDWPYFVAGRPALATTFIAEGKLLSQVATELRRLDEADRRISSYSH